MYGRAVYACRILAAACVSMKDCRVNPDFKSVLPRLAKIYVCEINSEVNRIIHYLSCCKKIFFEIVLYVHIL